MAEHIDTDAERDDACHCRDAVSVPGPKLGVTYHFSDCRVDTITDLCDEVDRLRRALINAGHNPACATNCKHAIHDCDCGWQDAVDPYLPTAEDVRGIFATGDTVADSSLLAWGAHLLDEADRG